MSLTKKDRELRSVDGKNIPVRKRVSAAELATVIAKALRDEFGSSGGALKKIVSLTAANERAVKNWLQAKNSPSAASLVELCRHSETVFVAVLLLAHRQEIVAGYRLVEARRQLRELLAVLDEIAPV